MQSIFTILIDGLRELHFRCASGGDLFVSSDCPSSTKTTAFAPQHRTVYQAAAHAYSVVGGMVKPHRLFGVTGNCRDNLFLVLQFQRLLKSAENCKRKHTQHAMKFWQINKLTQMAIIQQKRCEHIHQVS